MCKHRTCPHRIQRVKTTLIRITFFFLLIRAHININGGGRLRSVPSKGRPDTSKVYICGYMFVDFVRAVFPEKIHRELTTHSLAQATETDLLVWSGSCPLVAEFPGVILYVDGESGRMPKVPDQLTIRCADIFYAGVHDPPQPVTKHMQLFHMAHTTLLRRYSAYDLMKERKFTFDDIAPHFLLYVNSHCVSFREDAFDAIHTAAASHGIELPNARGRCHGRHPEASKFKDDRLHRNDNAVRIMGYRFILVMENTRMDGYITEKILDAYMARAVPVYYGTKDVFRIFNPDSFIYYDIEHPEPAIESLIMLERNKSAYLEKLSAPILAEGEKTLQNHFSLTDEVGYGLLKHAIRDMVGLKSNGSFEPKPESKCDPK